MSNIKNRITFDFLASGFYVQFWFYHFDQRHQDPCLRIWKVSSRSVSSYLCAFIVRVWISKNAVNEGDCCILLISHFECWKPVLGSKVIIIPRIESMLIWQLLDLHLKYWIPDYCEQWILHQDCPKIVFICVHILCPPPVFLSFSLPASSAATCFCVHFSLSFLASSRPFNRDSFIQSATCLQSHQTIFVVEKEKNCIGLRKSSWILEYVDHHLRNDARQSHPHSLEKVLYEITISCY